MLSIRCMLVSLSVGVAFAQNTSTADNNTLAFPENGTIWGLYFTTPSYLQESDVCFPLRRQEPGATWEAGGISFGLRENSTAFKCYNFRTLLPSNDSFADCIELSDGHVSCGNGFFGFPGQTYNASADYSVVGTFAQVELTDEQLLNDEPEDMSRRQDRVGKVTLETFENENCEEEPGASNKWNCLTSLADCSELEYSVRSFRILRTREDEMDQCLTAEVVFAANTGGGNREAASDQQGNAWKSKGASLVFLIAAAVGAAFFAW